MASRVTYGAMICLKVVGDCGYLSAMKKLLILLTTFLLWLPAASAQVTYAGAPFDIFAINDGLVRLNHQAHTDAAEAARELADTLRGMMADPSAQRLTRARALLAESEAAFRAAGMIARLQPRLAEARKGLDRLPDDVQQLNRITADGQIIYFGRLVSVESNNAHKVAAYAKKIPGLISFPAIGWHLNGDDLQPQDFSVRNCRTGDRACARRLAFLANATYDLAIRLEALTEHTGRRERIARSIMRFVPDEMYPRLFENFATFDGDTDLALAFLDGDWLSDRSELMHPASLMDYAKANLEDDGLIVDTRTDAARIALGLEIARQAELAEAEQGAGDAGGNGSADATADPAAPQ